MRDVLERIPELKIDCLDHGFVELVDVMPRLLPEEAETADFAIVQAARVSYGVGTKKVSEDKGLIRYLMRHRHTTPFEMIEFKFHCSMPIFVARQWIRHRTANVNEYSARYSVVPEVFHFPKLDNIRQQSSRNKQVSEGSTESGDANWFLNKLEQMSHDAYKMYEESLQKNIGREQARMILPLNSYTYWYWKIDLWNLLHFLSLRCDAHAQQEFQVYGNAMLKMVEAVAPWTTEAWNDYHPLRGAELLTKLEVEALRDYLQEQMYPPCAPQIESENKREKSEWAEKCKKLGFDTVFSD